MRAVSLLAFPVQLWMATREHTDELLREFTLVAGGREATPDGDVPARLVSLVREVRQQYGAGSDERNAPLFEAAEAGVESLDLQMELPVQAATAAQRLNDMLDEADRFCAEGEHLLTLATPPRLVAFRRWYLTQMTTQLEGAPAEPWLG